MKTYTLTDIDALNPCFDPRTVAPANWSGTLLDILNAENVKAVDRIWVVTGLLDDKTNRLFAVWCAREALKLVENPDPRSVAACDVAERFANGDATGEELTAAAWDAADAAWDAAWGAARDAADAAWGAAWDAAWDAARDAAGAAWGAAWSSARAAQIEKLKEMVKCATTTLN